MARAAILSNGKLAVGLNANGFVHDFYYPFVGQDNLTTARSSHHKIGISINGDFTWLEDSNLILIVLGIVIFQIYNISSFYTKKLK